AFKDEHEVEDGCDIIGQFGVGFYAAFMVADVVTVITKALGSDEAYKWQSEGADGYTIAPYEKDDVGTAIILQTNENADEENDDEFLVAHRVLPIVTKHSYLIRYPMKMGVTKSIPKEDDDEEYIDYVE